MTALWSMYDGLQREILTWKELIYGAVKTPMVLNEVAYMICLPELFNLEYVHTIYNLYGHIKIRFFVYVD